MDSHESRTAFSNPLGKCTAELKAKVPEEARELFDQMARSHGMSSSELLREMILLKVFGEDMLRSMYERRFSVVSAVGPEKVSK